MQERDGARGVILRRRAGECDRQFQDEIRPRLDRKLCAVEFVQERNVAALNEIAAQDSDDVRRTVPACFADMMDVPVMQGVVFSDTYSIASSSLYNLPKNLWHI